MHARRDQKARQYTLLTDVCSRDLRGASSLHVERMMAVVVATH